MEKRHLLYTSALVIGAFLVGVLVSGRDAGSGKPAADLSASASIVAEFQGVTSIASGQRGVGVRPQHPGLYKVYPDVERISLPEPDHAGFPFEEVLRQRRSARQYGEEALSLRQVSQLLFAAQGITGEFRGISLRTAPSAGALYPIEVYMIAHDVKGLEPGVYHYAPDKHALEKLVSGDLRGMISDIGLTQESLKSAGAVLVFSAIFDRTRSKYGDRGLRFVYLEAGHVSQNVLLQSTSLGLNAVPIGAFFDDELNALLGLDGVAEAALLILAIGAPTE